MGAEISKLALGTVQFGLDYGITNLAGKIELEKAHEILELCHLNDIFLLDTAPVYGDSERVIGRFVKNEKNGFQIVSKLPPCLVADVRTHFFNSLSVLGKNSLYGYLIHSYEDYKLDKKVYEEVRKIQDEGHVEKIGFSLYNPVQLEQILDSRVKLDIVQIPYNVLDQRFQYLLPELSRKGIEVHARSAFLQGLLLKKPADLLQQFEALKPKMTALQELAAIAETEISHLLLSFIHLNRHVQRIVIGVTSKNELLHNLAYVKRIRWVEECLPALQALAEEDEKLILPTNWK